MKTLIGLLEIGGVILALVTWGLVPTLLWDYGYDFLGMVAFVIIPLGLFALAHKHDELRSSPLRNVNAVGRRK